MPATYHIDFGGTETDLTDAGAENLTLERRTGAVSRATWTCDAPFDSDPLWAVGSHLALIRRGMGADEILLQGTLITADGDGEADTETVAYEITDAWADLEREIFRASRKIISGGEIVTYESARALLCMAANGERTTASTMCAAVVAYAAGIGIAIQAGTFDAPVLPPWDEVSDRTLAEIILRVLRWQPDAVAWLDHSVTPPALNVTRRANMTAAAVSVKDLDICRPRACRELVVPGVVISFERSAAGLTVSEQTAGNPAALGCARMTIPLEFEAGSPGEVQEIKAVALGDYTALAWWQRMFPWLPDDTILTEAAILPTPAPGFDNILTGGLITEWMQDRRLDAGSYTVTALAEFTRDGQTYLSKELSRTFTLTNAVSRRYIGKSDTGWSEPEPAGLAAAFYAAAKDLQYEGKLSATELECTLGRSLIGCCLNITGSKAAWATMGATVVAVIEQFDLGKTEIQIGPQTHLGPADLVELIRCSRNRSTWTPLSPLSPSSQAEAAVDPFAPDPSQAEAPGQLSGLDITDEIDA